MTRRSEAELVPYSSEPDHRIDRRAIMKLALAGSAGIAVSTVIPRIGKAQDEAIGVDTVAAVAAQIDTYVESLMAETGIPGIAIAIVADDQVAYLQGFGVRDAAATDPIDVDTIFQLASVSKPIASTVVAGLVSDGIVNWDDRLSDLLPGFALADPWVTANVTLRDMFSHRSGLPDHGGDLIEDLGYDREEMLQRLRYLIHGGEFRRTYAYTNFGLTAAAVAAATAAESTWEDVSESRLYEPLGMTRTSSRFIDFESDENHARTHVQDADGNWVDRYVRQPDPQSPAGGVSSTARDMATWMRLQLQNGTLDDQSIIAAEPLAETHLPHIVSSAPDDPTLQQAGFYGLGWNVSYSNANEVRLSHSGAFALGASTVVNLLPAHGLGVVVLTNAAPIGVPESVALTAIDLIMLGAPRFDYFPILGPIIKESVAPQYDAVTGKPNPNLPPLDPRSYVGSYDNDFFGPLVIEEVNSELAMRLGPQDMTFGLTHFGRDVFTYQPEGENAGGPSAVTFTIGSNGLASAVVVDNLDIHGVGTFVRPG